MKLAVRICCIYHHQTQFDAYTNYICDKMVNGSRYYRALESVSRASAFVYRSYHLSMPDPSPSTLTV